MPRTWQRPLHQITADLERYEALILAALEKPVEEMLMLLVSEALEIRAKQKKEAVTEPDGLLDLCEHNESPELEGGAR